MESREEKLVGTIIDEICCILAERDKMIEGIMRGEVTESDVEAIARTRKGTAKLLYRLISDKTPRGNHYVHLRSDDARAALRNSWPELLYNASQSIATSPFVTPEDMRELRKLLNEEE